MIKVYLTLLLIFFKIGLFSFGGGYAMIPMIQREIESQGWLTTQEFVDVIVIAEMTPGPIAINSATFVGFKVAGVPGGVFATLGVSLPSIILVMFVSRFFFKYENHPIKEAIFYGVRPAITGLIFSAAITVAGTALFRTNPLDLVGKNVSSILEVIKPGSIIISIIALFLLARKKVHPIVVIMLSGIMGILLYHVLPSVGVNIFI
ncbi:MAG: chromate transporter [Clostridiaceae bacterium]|nr:chromate transporter [Clostridiaceae bacterium]